MKNAKNFASDNCAGVHPDIMAAMAAVNEGHTIAYGDDIYTKSAIEKFKSHFGDDIEVYFVFNGTGANVLGIQAAARSFNSVVCANTAHINCDECGAPENFIGCKLVTLPSPDGKIAVNQIEQHLHVLGNQHHSQPKVISITQSTELGTVYTPAEINTLADFAHQNGMYLHMDGARIANAAASLGVGLNAVSGAAGVDILSFGGAKNGMMFGEAAVIFNEALGEGFEYIRKQGMQLASKMRFIAAQFDALLSNDLWLRNARHANRMAQLLSSEAARIPGVRITQKVEANGIFAALPKEFIPQLQEKYYFYVWDEEASVVRWMLSFDTTEDDVKDFIQILRETIVL